MLHVSTILRASGGIGTWLLALARSFNRHRFSFEFAFYVHSPCSLASEIASFGCRVHSLEAEGDERLEQLLRTDTYDIVHVHSFPSSRNPLRVAAARGVGLRIFHSHSVSSVARAQWREVRTDASAAPNLRLAVSRSSARSTFGRRAWVPGYYSLQPSGVDLAPFRDLRDLDRVRHELGVPPTSLVLGTIGRLAPEKNLSMLLRIGAELHRRGIDFRTLLLGDGPLHHALEEEARTLGIGPFLLPIRTSREVARVLCGAMDVFVFPSLGEGLGLALLEAQAAGVPCVVSEHANPASVVIPSLVHKVRLRAGPTRWADKITAVHGRKLPLERALEHVERSPFEATRTVRRIESLYLSKLAFMCGDHAIADSRELDSAQT